MAPTKRVFKPSVDTKMTPPTSPPRQLRWRLAASVVWAALATLFIVVNAIVSWTAFVLIGIVTALMFTSDRSARNIARVFKDWFAVVFLTIFYGVSRGAADTLGMPVQEKIWVDIDRWLGFGELPTHRLQRLIDWDAAPKWWEASFSIMYISFFVVAFTVMIALYVVNRELWIQWYSRRVLLGLLAVAAFILIPSAPPWMASESGNIATVHDSLQRGWDAIHVEWIHNLFSLGRNEANPIAAMPSLHAASPALMYLFWAPHCGRVLRSLMIAYTLFMGFTIVITGQHWLIDVFAGWLWAWAAHRMVTRYEASRKARRAATPVKAREPRAELPWLLETEPLRG